MVPKLHDAIIHRHLDTIKYLIEVKKADLNVKDDDGRTPLHLAAEKDHLSIVKSLIKDKKADLNVKDNDGNTPLHLAVEKHHLDTVKCLIEAKKADLNVQDNDGNSPLHLAALNGHLHTVKYFIEEKGADPLARNNHDSVLHNAVSSNNKDVIVLILDKIKDKLIQDSQLVYQHINAPDAEGDTPLMWAAETGKVDAVRILLEYGVDINAKNTDGETALHWAVKGGYQGVVQLLLDKQADPNIKDKDGKPPLDIAKDQLIIVLLSQAQLGHSSSQIQSHRKQQKICTLM